MNNSLAKQILNKINSNRKYHFDSFDDINSLRQTPLQFVFCFNGYYKIFLSNKELDYLIKNSNLNNLDIDGQSPIITALEHNQIAELNLTPAQWDYLMENSDLTIIDADKNSALLAAFRNNKKEQLNFTSEQFTYLIKHSNLGLISDWGYLNYALYLNKSSNLKLTESHFDQLIDIYDFISSYKKNIELVDLAISANKEDHISIKIIKKIIKDNNITDVLEYFNGSSGNKAKDSQKTVKFKLLIEMIVDEKEINLALRQNAELKTPKI